MMIRRNQIVNNNSLCEPNIDTPDKNKARTEWKKWMARYKKKIEKELAENQNNQEIQCKQCKKFVSKKSYVTHNTVKRCKNLHKFVRLKHYKYAYENDQI